MYAATGDYDRAAADFDKALALNPRDKDASNEVARFYAPAPTTSIAMVKRPLSMRNEPAN